MKNLYFLLTRFNTLIQKRIFLLWLSFFFSYAGANMLCGDQLVVSGSAQVITEAYSEIPFKDEIKSRVNKEKLKKPKSLKINSSNFSRKKIFKKADSKVFWLPASRSSLISFSASLHGRNGVTIQDIKHLIVTSFRYIPILMYCKYLFLIPIYCEDHITSSLLKLPFVRPPPTA